MSAQQGLEFITVETGADPTAAVIWLHGLGADGHDFEAIVPELDLTGAPPIRFIFPHAPVRPVTINHGMVMRAWYDILEMDIDRKIDHEGLEESAALIQELIADQISLGIPADRVILAGFSQGGAMTYHVGLPHHPPLGGLMVLSAYLADPQVAADPGSVPLLCCHGTLDPVVPHALGKSSADRLIELGWPVEWHDYMAPHGLHPQQIGDISHWLVNCLSDSGNPPSTPS